MSLPYLVSILCGLLLAGLLIAFVFRRDFRRDCLAKEGELQIAGISVQGAIVLCLFVVLLAGPVYAVKLDSDSLNESVSALEAERADLENVRATLETERRELNQKISRLERLLEVRKTWTVLVELTAPRNLPPDFEFDNGVFTVTPASIIPLNSPRCGSRVCTYTMQVKTRQDETFEEAVNLITYNNGPYFAHINPKEIFRRFESGETELLKNRSDGPVDGLRHYGAIAITDGSRPITVDAASLAPGEGIQ